MKKRINQINNKNSKTEKKHIDKNKNIKDKIINLLVNSSENLLIFITNILIITNLLLIFKISISNINFYVSLIITIIFIYIKNHKNQTIKNISLSILISLFVFFIATISIGKIYDSTADGNTYHKLAVGAIKNGWNPIYGSVGKFNKDKGNPFDIYKDNVNIKWVDHYAKGTETFAAVIYHLSGNIESGKVFNLLWIFIGLGILFKLFNLMKYSKFKSFILSAILTFNPIILVQITNYYLDGVLTISLFIIILICIIQKDKFNKEEENNLYIILFCCLIWAINTKFNGLAYAGVFCGVLYLYRHIRNYIKTKKEFIKPLIKDTVFYIVTLFFSIIIVGAGSYTKNMINYGSPLYPLYGKNHIPSMIMKEIPKSMGKYSPTKQFFVSIFSKGENVSPSYSKVQNGPDLKVPFTTSKEEIYSYTIPDIRIGGFGPMFSGIFIITIIGLIYIIVESIKKKEFDLLTITTIVIVTNILLICLINGSYWARYIPYLYLIPVLVLGYYLKRKNNKFIKVIEIFTILLFLTNSLLIAGVQISNTYKNNEYLKYRKEAFIQYSKSNDKVKINLAHHGIQGVQYNIDDWHIHNYELTDNKELKNDCYMFKY